MDAADTIRVAIADTSVLINLAHTKHPRLLGSTSGYRFCVPEEVLAEILDQEQKEIVESAIAAGLLESVAISTVEELATYTALSQILGSGESACLAIASSRGWTVACDERRVFLREARARVGEDRLLNTPGLYLLWIRTGLLTVVEADAAKLTLEGHRFRMAFRSFQELL